MKNLIMSLFFFMGLLITTQSSLAHCDTKDGPVVAAAIQAIKEKNINYALIWVKPAYEKEVKEAFESTMKVRVLSPEAERLADNYFFETLVRLHRSGEGLPYTGLKPAGTPIDKRIVAADKSILLGSLAPLNNLVAKNKLAELKKRFDKAMSLKNYDVNNVAAGREYVEAYVQFFHFAEGEAEVNSGHIGKNKHEH
jgi:hypothetical protein